MLKRRLIFSALAALIISGFPSNILAAGLRGGFFGAANPVLLVPASADVYVELNRAGTLGDNLKALVQTYQSHPGTAAAVNGLTQALGPEALQQFNTLLKAAPARVGVFATIPFNSSTQPRVAIIAQLQPGSILNGGNPLSGLATFSPSTSYQGVSIYRVSFTNGLGSGYGAVVSGDGVIAGDVASIRSVIDAATFHTPSLSNDTDFNTTLGQIARLQRSGTESNTLTLYVARHFLTQATRAAMQGAPTTGATGAATQAALRALQRSYAVGITAYPNGISIVSSNLPQTTPLSANPNNGAGVVGNTALVYTSLFDLAGLLRSSGVFAGNTLSQAKAQTGIDIANDVLPLISREVVVDINDETSPLIGLGLAASSSNSALGSIPQLPGSLELATEVSDQTSAQASVNRIVAALTKAAGGAAASGSLFQQVTLPDGSAGYTISVLPSFGYTFRNAGGHTFLVLSTNLQEDVRAAKAVPLAADTDYTGAVGSLTAASPHGIAPFSSVNYTSIARLLAAADKLLAYPQIKRAVGASTITAYQQQIKPLIAPFRNVIAVSRIAGPTDAQSQTFITVR